MGTFVTSKKSYIWVGCFLLFLGSIYMVFTYFPFFIVQLFQHSPIMSHKEEAQKSLENTLTSWVYNNSIQISQQSANLIVKESMKANNSLLLLALIKVESEFNPSAISSKGAVGLTQIMFNIHGKELIKEKIIRGKRDLFNISQSIQAGNFILIAYLVRSNGNVSRALELYLGGKSVPYSHRILSNLADLYVLTSG